MTKPVAPTSANDKGFYTVPNLVTVLRFFLFLFVLFELARSTHSRQHGLEWVAIFAIVILLDVADGYIARHHQQISIVGTFLDHFVDKIQTFMALFWLVGVFQEHGAGWVSAFYGILWIRLLQDTVSEMQYIRDWKAGTPRKSNLPGKIKVWADMLGCGLAYIVYVTSRTANPTTGVKVLCLGSGIAMAMAFLSLYIKRTERQRA